MYLIILFCILHLVKHEPLFRKKAVLEKVRLKKKLGRNRETNRPDLDFVCVFIERTNLFDYYRGNR